MSDDPILERCAALGDIELIRTITSERALQSESFQTAARLELAARGIDLGRYTATVRFRFESEAAHRNADTMALPVEEAVQRLALPMTDWEAAFVANAIGDWVIVQQDGVFHELHFFVEGEYLTSCTTATLAELQGIAHAFLRLEDWQARLDRDYDLADWSTVAQADDPIGLGFAARALAEAKIPFALRGLEQARFDPVLGVTTPGGSNLLLVDHRRLAEAHAALATAEQRVRALWTRAAALAGRAQPDAELEIYQELSRRAPHDAAAALRLGELLLERGCAAEAVEPALRAVRAAEESERTGAEHLLERLASRLPENLPVLHTLASLHLDDGDDARAEHDYRAVLAVAPEDAIAHLNLGHLYLRAEEDALARTHFATFLRLRPAAPERQGLEVLLAGLSDAPPAP